MNTAFDATLQAAANYHLRQLREGNYESAFHGLTELNPAIVRPLIAAYRAETSSETRDSLLRIISELRTSSALPLFDETLRDRRNNHWRIALDGLVTIASSEAIQTLESVLHDESMRPDPDSSFIEWLREAVDQAKQAHWAKSSSTGNV